MTISNKFKNSYLPIKNEYYTNFPDCSGIDKKQLLVSEYGKMSMTTKDESLQILNIILDLFPNKKIIITDATGNIGGDTIRFGLSPRVKKVNTFEINKETFQLLENNINVYNLGKKVVLSNSNYCNKWKDIKQDVVYIDAPWGKNYKLITMINLSLDGSPLDQLVSKLIENKCCKYIALKVPYNFSLSQIMVASKINNVTVHKIQRYNPFYLIMIKV
jgi:hypothetical protein